MAIYPIRSLGDPVLRLETREVTEFDERLQKLIDDMIETMDDAQGVGLAAPQVGIQKRLFVYDFRDGNGPNALANAVLVSSDGEWTYDEGCLSVRHLFFPVVRPNTVHVTGQDRNGEAVSLEVEEFPARVLQHEIDHLYGRLILDRLDPQQRKEAMRVLRERELNKAK